ncbi:MAG: serine/threonine protein kinase [Prevotella sp.]
MDENTIKPNDGVTFDTGTQDGLLQRTMNIDSNLDVTGRLDDVERTFRSEPAIMTNIVEDSFEIKGRFYKKLKCLSDNSGEAQVFLVENDGRELVLKVYYPNFTLKRKLMKIVANFDFEMIVQIFDFGKIYVEGVNRDYELMEYLRGGTLSHYQIHGDLDKFRRIALQGAAALAYCHNNNIIHKDIKPGNFFFRDEEHTQVVLGDFGISSVIHNKDELHRTTQARTPIYASPEMYNDVIDGIVELTPATDYYSLGITLLALWRGNSPFNVGERTIMKRKNEGRLPGMETLPERVRLLIAGLTAVNIQKRWTYNEVEQWFLGESPEVDLSSPFLRYKTFVVDPERNLAAENVQELIPMLLNNERIARGYLYGGRLGNWFESCGNSKMAMVLKDIVQNRYPVDQHAGLMAAVYSMDPSWPYVDINGQDCNNIHSLAVTLLLNIEKYQMLLRNPNDNVWVYAECHTDCDINRMRGYFTGAQPQMLKIALLRTIYELDKEMPFFAKHKSRTIKDIVHCFGYEDMTESEWRSITDGRLLSWMYSHEDVMACEALRIMTEGKPFSMTLAYKVLYNIDRTAAFDLRSANTPKKVGMLLSEKLKQWQNLDEKAFAERIADFSDKEGRFLYFAHLHGWNKQIHDCVRCFDIKSEENRERFGAYDLHTAAYRFCRLLDATPSYKLASGTVLEDGRMIETRDVAEMRSEIRNGSFVQWLSVFYHENPFEDFSIEYSYERSLEQWIMAIGSIDPQQTYYRRFIKAKEETERKYEEVRVEYKRSCRRARILKRLFYGLSALWILSVILFGIHGRRELIDNGFVTVCLPVGMSTAIIVGVSAFFKGFGVTMATIWATFGFLTSFIPLLAIRYVNNHMPILFLPTVLVLTALYILICYFTDNRKEGTEDKELVAEVMDDDMKSSLLEPLFYTFKTRSSRFNGSKFGLLEDVKNQFKSVSSDSVIHYALWSVLVFVLLMEMILFNHHLLNFASPY